VKNLFFIAQTMFPLLCITLKSAQFPAPACDEIEAKTMGRRASYEDEERVERVTERCWSELGVVAYTCNSSYSGGGGRRIVF
jgi:hypothetical protein